MKRALLLAAVLLSGCVYYNGMYNANKFAKRAEKAQRQGRTFEAQGYWAQAEVRADSLIARHPNSKWVDDAQLIRGEASVNRGDCPGAIPDLEAASMSRDSPKVAQRALVLLGDCRLKAGNLAGADLAFTPLMQSSDTAIRHAAQFQHARILRLDGQYQEALSNLDDLSGTAVENERAADYAGLGDLARARPLIDSALARQDTTVAWDSTLAGIGRVDAGLASQYTSQVVALPGLGGETRDELLNADGMRLLPTDPDSGLARLNQSAVAKPVTNASLVARLRIAEYYLGRADTIPQLQLARPVLTPLSQVGGPSAIRALDYLKVLDQVQAWSDSVTPGAPQGDLATFVVAESVRDGLPAPRIAAQLFGAVPVWWPNSPYAPKALLALAALEPAQAVSIRATIEVVYPGSPYLQLVSGDVTPAVLALEDSLQLYASANAGSGKAAGARRAPTRAPAGQRNQDELK
jgi:tetratricopeptide (TPR) repeat protein